MRIPAIIVIFTVLTCLRLRRTGKEHGGSTGAHAASYRTGYQLFLCQPGGRDMPG
jgi:hypothetical protein